MSSVHIQYCYNLEAVLNFALSSIDQQCALIGIVSAICDDYRPPYLVPSSIAGHIRGRLRKLMARRPERDTLKNKGILEGT